MESTTVNPTSILTGNAPNIALRPGDRVIVPEGREYRQNYRVEIEGEVVRPGQYPITKNMTRLSEVIREAGSFTADANIRGATLMRARVSPLELPDEIEREQLLSMRASLGDQDSAYYLTETALRIKGEVVSVDFHKLFVEGDSTQDVILRTFDRIIVPAKRRTVYVFGQVISPGHIGYQEGERVAFYIAKAGGYTKDARTGDVKVIKGNTRAWLDPGETTIEDGDYIWVPKDQYYPFSYYINVYAQVAGIIGAAATVALLIRTIR
ncbi:MAG: SLBB domain-containing protein [Ignavibacteriae bacterium]|nr:SLBB domain-containing protein [Ignavibacteriota bacterium]